MFGFDAIPFAAANIDLAADFAPLLWGLCGLLWLSAAGIAINAISSWRSHSRLTANLSAATTATEDFVSQEHANAA